MPEIILGDHTPAEHPDLSAGMRGCVPRDLHTAFVGYSAAIPPSTIKPLSRDEIILRIADMEASRSRISDALLRGDAGRPIPSYDQNGQGYCWYYGMIGALTAKRALQQQPYVRLSGHAGACKIKGFRDEGGWGALAYEDVVLRGCPDVDHWKEKSMSRQYDTPATWENAKLYRPDCIVADLTSPVYDRNMAFALQLTMLVLRNPTTDDYDYWGHCVMGCDAVNGNVKRMETRADSGKLATVQEFELIWGVNNPVTQGLAKRGRNSWGDQYGDRGFFVATGSKAVADNCVAMVTAIA
jgi:hypothetical protein